MGNAVQIYHAYPQRRYSINDKPEKAILYVSDIYGVPLLQNKLYLALPPPRILSAKQYLTYIFKASQTPSRQPATQSFSPTSSRATRSPCPHPKARSI